MEQNCGDPFAAENVGTARFVGAAADGEPTYGGLANNVAAGGALSGMNCGGTVSATHEFQTMKPTNSQKPQATGRTEIPHSELVKMLCYMEGELQARDVVIAALRNERVKQFITQLRTKRVQPNDPYAAIFRDKVALAGNLITRESSTQAAQADMEVRQIIEQQMEQQYQMVNKQRATHLRMVNILTESLENNQRMLQELEEEKRKHEHDTAQGDDITYGLELERTKLRQELEEERAQLKKMEKDMKKLQETLDYERNRQKQIVLLLIAERKKILMKYIEEGKRSEDLAQILAEEKQRSDTIADGLEEESKKSLRMEEEIEKQAAAFETERKTLRVCLAKEEQRVKELEQELALLRAENDALKKHQLQQQQHSAAAVAGGVAGVPPGGTKARALTEEACATPMVNIAKIVQPTATVSSVPVSGPTTGIARSIAPGQNIRTGVATAPTLPPAAIIASSSANDIGISIGIGTLTTGTGTATTSAPAPIATPIATTITVAAVATAATPQPLSAAAVVAIAAASAAPAPPSPLPIKMQPTATIQRAPGGKYSALAAAAAAAGAHSSDQPALHPVPIAVPPVTVPPAGARGAPPPIPPNKPIVPPKREPSLSRLASITAGGGSGGAGGGVGVVSSSSAVAAAVASVAAAGTVASANALGKLN